MAEQKIAIIGAGNVGGNLGVRLAGAGHRIWFGVKPDSDTKALLARCNGHAESVSVADAIAHADVVFVALPGGVAVDVMREVARGLSGKVVVDCTNPIGFDAGGPTHAPPAEGSNAAAIAKVAPGARVVKAFNTFGAEFHLDPRLAHGQSIDVQIAGDDPAARAAVADIAKSAGFAPLDLGGLRNAALLEALAVLWIHLAVKGGQGREIGFKVLPRGH